MAKKKQPTITCNCGHAQYSHHYTRGSNQGRCLALNCKCPKYNDHLQENTVDETPEPTSVPKTKPKRVAPPTPPPAPVATSVPTTKTAKTPPTTPRTIKKKSSSTKTTQKATFDISRFTQLRKKP